MLSVILNQVWMTQVVLHIFKAKMLSKELFSYLSYILDFDNSR